MAKILVGIAEYQPDHRFRESLPAFLTTLSEFHEVEKYAVRGATLPDAQNEYAAVFLSGSYDYLLTMEDDVWGWTPSMVGSLIAGNAPVVAMKYYSRYPPYFSCLMTYTGNTNPKKCYRGSEGPEHGYYPIDLCGFGFTLIRRDAFDALDEPYFRYSDDRKQYPDRYGTDRDFCDRLRAADVTILGCNDYCLRHRDISSANVFKLREEIIAHVR